MKKKLLERKQTRLAFNRHKLLLRTLSENLRNGMSFGEAMRLAGYSQSYSEAPQQLKDTDAWKLLVKTEIKDTKLLKVLNYLLDHKDWRANDAGLDKALKIKNRYAPSEHNVTVRKRPLYEIEDEIARTLS